MYSVEDASSRRDESQLEHRNVSVISPDPEYLSNPLVETEPNSGVSLDDEMLSQEEDAEPRPSLASLWTLSLCGINLGVSEESRGKLRQVLFGRLIWLILIVPTVALFIIWQVFPLSTVAMVFSLLSALIVTILFALKQVLTTTPPLENHEAFYALHRLGFIILNGFFFLVNHLDCLQTQLQMLQRLNDYTDIRCDAPTACSASYDGNFDVVVYFPWFLIPLLISGVAFTVHHLYFTQQFTWLKLHLLTYVYTNIVTYIFWWQTAWYGHAWPYFLVTLLPWGALCALHYLWVRIDLSSGFSVTVAGITISASRRDSHN